MCTYIWEETPLDCRYLFGQMETWTSENFEFFFQKSFESGGCAAENEIFFRPSSRCDKPKRFAGSRNRGDICYEESGSIVSPNTEHHGEKDNLDLRSAKTEQFGPEHLYRVTKPGLSVADTKVPKYWNESIWN